MTYRDDKATLEARRDDLRHELDAVRRKAREGAEALGRQAALERELADVEQRIASRRSGVLENLRIAAPCSADWEAMKGDDRVRFCGECEKNVYNLSAMPRKEAGALLIEREGNVCVRLYQRADGTVLTADCPVGVRRRKVRRVAAAAVGAGAMAAAALSLVRLRTKDESPSEVGVVTMGATGMPVSPPPNAQPDPTYRPVMGAPPPVRHVMGKPARLDHAPKAR